MVLPFGIEGIWRLRERERPCTSPSARHGGLLRDPRLLGDECALLRFPLLSLLGLSGAGLPGEAMPGDSAQRDDRCSGGSKCC